jgi:hypothetical protein
VKLTLHFLENNGVGFVQSTQLVGREVLQTFSKFFHGFFKQSHLITLIIVYW